MPAVRDWTWNYSTTTTSTTIAATLPDYAQNDLLVAICSTDTATQTWSSAGWTVLFSVTNTMNLAVLWKIAGAAETDPTFKYVQQESANVRLISIRDVDTTTPFNGTGGAGTGYRTANNSAARVALPVLTTTVNNSLLLYINSESGAVVPGVLEGPCTFEMASDGTAHSDGFSWGFQATAGASPSTVFANKSGTAAGVIATIGISPPAGGATVIPTYCAGDSSIYVDPIHGTTAYNGNTAFAATVTTDYGTTLNGRTLSNGTAAAAADVGINSFHSMGQLTGVTTVNTVAGARLAIATANKPNASGKNVLCHVKPSTPKVLQNTDSVTKGGTFPKGVYFGMASDANNFKFWHVHGANTVWDSASHLPIVINDQNTTGLQQSTGTLNPASVSSFGFGVSGFLVAPVWQFGSLWVLDTTIVAGGNNTEPISIPGIFKVCSAGKERMSVLQQGATQALVLQPIQFGNGGTNPTYLNLDSTAIEFPQQYNQDTKNVFYCSADNVAGITYYAGASDTIKHKNSVVSSKSKFHWKFHASSSGSASYDFDGLSVIGAGTITLHASVPLTGVTWNGCDQITAANNTLTSCIFTSSTATATQGAISITGASQSELQTNLDKFVSCSWTNNTIPAGALRIIYTGAAGAISLNMTSGTFSGNTSDIRWEAPSGSNLTLNLSGTANPSTYSATNSNTVTFIHAKVFSVSNIILNSEVRLYLNSDLTELGGVENVSGSPSGLNNVSVSSDPDNAGRYIVSYSYNYTTDTPIVIVVVNNQYQVLRTTATLKSTNQTIPVNQLYDRQYLNP